MACYGLPEIQMQSGNIKMDLNKNLQGFYTNSLWRTLLRDDPRTNQIRAP